MLVQKIKQGMYRRSQNRSKTVHGLISGQLHIFRSCAGADGRHADAITEYGEVRGIPFLSKIKERFSLDQHSRLPYDPDTCDDNGFDA